jgi:signal transduction histidine kinase
MRSREQLIDMLPEWMRSARFRITILYSTVLFLLAAVVVGTLYLALLSTLKHQFASPLEVRDFNQNGVLDGSDEGVAAFLRAFDEGVETRTLENMKRYTFAVLGALFVVSLGVGWVIAGRVLSPIERITDVANHIQATDLSQRIRLDGPADELKRLADTFDGMLARLDEAFNTQRQFIADASHELRNPLAVIRTNVDVALADSRSSEEDLRQTAIVVRRAEQRMSRLVDDLLALARLEAPGKLTETVDLTSVAGEVAEDFSALARARSVAIDLSGEPGLTVTGDRDTLKRAVANLVDNALRVVPEHTRIVVGTGDRNGWAWIGVEDRGPGIALEDQSKIFERFWRTDDSRARAHGGSGLGLAIVKQIAASHSGAVRLYSEPGKGSCFVLWLPTEGRGTATERGDSSIPEVSPLARPVVA